VVSSRSSAFSGFGGFSPDGDGLPTGPSRRIFLWETRVRGPLAKLMGMREAHALAFSPDGGRWPAAGWITRSGCASEIDQEVAILKGHSEWVWCIAFAEHGNAFFPARGRTLKIWRALTFEQIQAQLEPVPTRPVAASRESTAGAPSKEDALV